MCLRQIGGYERVCVCTLSSWSLLLMVDSRPSTVLLLFSTSLSRALTASASMASVTFNLWPICSARSQAWDWDWLSRAFAISYTQRGGWRDTERKNELNIYFCSTFIYPALSLGEKTFFQDRRDLRRQYIITVWLCRVSVHFCGYLLWVYCKLCVFICVMYSSSQAGRVA